MPLNFYLKNEVLSKFNIFNTFDSFLKTLSPDKVADGSVEVLVDGNYIEISLENLLNGVLKKKASDSYLQFMNYMAFRIRKSKNNPPPNDKALLISFDALLKSPGVFEKERLKSCVKMVNRIKNDAVNYFFTPFLNVCQSSGSGKTKIATELMLEIPSFYVVLREKVFDKDSSKMVQFGYPYMSAISELFWDVPLDQVDDENQPSVHASSSIVGRYILLLKALFSDYLDALLSLIKTNRNYNLESALKSIFQEIIDGTFMGKELKFCTSKPNWDGVYINKTTHKFQQNQDSESNLLTMENVVKSCHILLEKIDLIRKKASAKDIHSHPFVLIVDEASLLCTKCSVTGISLFRLLRRAVNRLGSNCNFVFLTLGTNSDVLDLNPDLSFDPFRESVIGRTFPPFLLSRNWDLFIDYDELQKSPIGYNEMLKGRMMIFWASLGRPLWSSISFERLMSFVRTKICNKSVESGEAFLAFWMVRVGLLVNPTHVVTQHLVQSLMGTLLYVSPDLRSLRVYYPSEPVLAVEIRAMLMEDFYFDKYYAALERFIKQRAIDTGPYSEIISADICLLAIAKSKGKKMKCSWEYDKNLPKICNVNSFIFEASKFHTETVNAKIIELLKSETRKDGNFISKLFGEKYIIIEGIEFVRSLYGFEEKEKIHIYSQIERFYRN